MVQANPIVVIRGIGGDTHRSIYRHVKRYVDTAEINRNVFVIKYSFNVY